LGIY
jgi:hypothetical protein